MRLARGFIGFYAFIGEEIWTALARLIPDDDCTQFLSVHPNAQIRSTR